MGTVANVLMVLAGVVLVCVVLDSAMRTFVLPRAVVSRLTRIVFRALRVVFDKIARRFPTYEGRDRVMALYAPFGLLSLVVVWLLLLIGAYALMFRGAVVGDWTRAVELSGSSLFTLGFVVPPQTAGGYILAFAEAASGLAVLALLIAYLPTIYGAFSRRELLVAKLAVRAGTPPTAIELIERYHAIGWSDQLHTLWGIWEDWFAELSETHTTFAVLSFFRSPDPHRSWITAAGAVLDGAAMANSTLSIPWSPEAGLCIRAGYIALRELADLYGIPYDPDPAPDGPISISRDEFDDAYRHLGEAGVPIRPDRDRAWRDFAGWRVNYDGVLLALAGLTMAPYAPWSSDRSLRVRRPPIMHIRTASSRAARAARLGE
jgi:hypothetical protein